MKKVMNEARMVKIIGKAALMWNKAQRSATKQVAQRFDSEILWAHYRLMGLSQEFLNMAKHGEYDTVEEAAKAYLQFMSTKEWQDEMEKLANAVKANDTVWSILKTMTR
jgi:hypothetical protein